MSAISEVIEEPDAISVSTNNAQFFRPVSLKEIFWLLRFLAVREASLALLPLFKEHSLVQSAVQHVHSQDRVVEKVLS